MRERRLTYGIFAGHITARNDEGTKRAFTAAYACVGDGLDYEYRGMAIVRPGTPDEIVAEGNALHHCVGSYIGRIAKRECLILFLRRREDLAKPFYTIEVRHRRIIQVRGQGNRDPTPEVQNFVDHWTREVLRAAVLKAA